MKSLMRRLLPILLVFAPVLAGAEPLALRTAFEVGDAYLLQLSTRTETEAESRTGETRRFVEEVELRYRADVVVLAVDPTGRPTRERHFGVRLTHQRPDGNGTLFGSGTNFEVRREAGETRLYVKGERVAQRLETVVADVLRWQFEPGVGPDLLDPGRAVSEGESWPLDPELAERFARSHGVRVLTMGDPGRATLERDPDTDQLGVTYEVPIRSFTLDRLPQGRRPSETTAVLAGRVRLPTGPRELVTHTSRLELALHGSAAPEGSALPWPWSARSRTTAEERAERVPSVARATGPAPPASRAD